MSYACEKGDAAVVSLLCANGASVNEVAKGGNSLLHYAAAAGSVEIVAILLTSGSKRNFLDDCNEEGESALHVAAKCGQVHVAEELLRRGANPETKTSGGDTALHSAARLGFSEFCETVLARISDDAQRIRVLRAHDSCGNVAQLIAADRSTFLLLDAWRKKCGIPQHEFATNEKGQTAVHIACSRIDDASVLLVGTLLDMAESPDARAGVAFLRDIEGRTPLHVAVAARNVAALTALVEAALQGFTSTTLAALLEEAATSPNFLPRVSACVDALLRPLEMADAAGLTVLHEAARNVGTAGCCTYLLQLMDATIIEPLLAVTAPLTTLNSSVQTAKPEGTSEADNSVTPECLTISEATLPHFSTWMPEKTACDRVTAENLRMAGRAVALDAAWRALTALDGKGWTITHHCAVSNNADVFLRVIKSQTLIHYVLQRLTLAVSQWNAQRLEVQAQQASTVESLSASTVAPEQQGATPTTNDAPSMEQARPKSKAGKSSKSASSRTPPLGAQSTESEVAIHSATLSVVPPSPSEKPLVTIPLSSPPAPQRVTSIEAFMHQRAQSDSTVPLHIAVRSQSLEVLRILLSDVEECPPRSVGCFSTLDESGRTLLDFAVREGDVASLSLLTQAMVKKCPAEYIHQLDVHSGGAPLPDVVMDASARGLAFLEALSCSVVSAEENTREDASTEAAAEFTRTLQLCKEEALALEHHQILVQECEGGPITRHFLYSELRMPNGLGPNVINPKRREEYLTDDEFEKVFGVDRATFRRLPERKREARKAQCGLQPQ